MVLMVSESDSSVASGSDSSNSSAKRLLNSCPSCPATFYLSSAYEEGSTVKVCGSHYRGVDGSLCETRIWKKMDLALGACKECTAAVREAHRPQQERMLDEKRQQVVECRRWQRQLEARLRRQFDVAWPAAQWTELLAGESPSGCEKESGRSIVVSPRDIAELVCRLEEN